MLPAAPGFETRDRRGTILRSPEFVSELRMASTSELTPPDRQRMSTEVRVHSSERRWTAYAGVTSDVARRHVEHNAGNCTHTAKYRPWSIDLATTLMGHDPHGDIHTQRIAPSSEGVKVLRVITFPLPAI
jgi:hypothetical protein